MARPDATLLTILATFAFAFFAAEETGSGTGYASASYLEAIAYVGTELPGTHSFAYNFLSI